MDGILINLLLVAAKIIIGLLSGSLAVVADGLNNLMDAAGSIITLAGFRISVKKLIVNILSGMDGMSISPAL